MRCLLAIMSSASEFQVIGNGILQAQVAGLVVSVLTASGRDVPSVFHTVGTRCQSQS